MYVVTYYLLVAVLNTNCPLDIQPLEPVAQFNA
jgi:hypothetical protein